MAKATPAAAARSRGPSASDRLTAMLSKYSDIVLAFGVVVIIGLLIFRVTTEVMDILLALNISVSCLILLTALYIPDAMKLPSFPTILLLTTLFRLALEVSATRLILLEANAGEIINAFGNFVVAGNFVVGGVVFLILTLVQFLVVAKGSERVAEVAARFTLDAMPGKQMSIDADLRNQLISPEQARERRQALERESKLYGAMDGAMKFVKGDAIAGIIIALVNIIGGMVVGVLQQGMTPGEAAQTFTLLTIGDGLVSQIPALLICVSAGLVVTRVAGAQQDPAGGGGGNVARDIVENVLGNPKALAVVSVVLALTGFVPGFPKFAFWTFAALTGALSFPRLAAAKAAGFAGAMAAAPGAAAPGAPAGTAPGAKPGAPGAPLDDGKAMPRRLYPVPAVLELGHDLERMFTNPDGTARPEQRQLLEEGVREMLSEETGISFPAVSLRIENPQLRPNEYGVVVFDATLARGAITPDLALALADAETCASRGIQATAMRIPWSRATACAISIVDIDKATEAGIRTLSADKMIVNHVLVTLRRNASEFVGIQEVSNLIERLKQERPDLIKAVIPTQLTLAQVTEVIKHLLRERTPVRDLRAILESLAKHSQNQKSPAALAELVRRDLRRLLCAKYSVGRQTLHYYAMQPDIERMIQEATVETASGPEVALPFSDQRRIIDAMEKTIDPRRHLVNDPVVLTAIPGVRRYLRQAMEFIFPEVVFLSFQELAPECVPNQVGIITLADGEAA
jgi:type III secretion protein V